MKRLVVLLIALSLTLLAACASSPTEEAGNNGEGPVVTVYRPPT